MGLSFASKITLGRILSVPFLIVSVLYYTPEADHLRFVALGIFLFAVISDAVDGFIAKRYHQQTEVGTALDPLADKLLLISAFLCLYKVGVFFETVRFPVWLVVTVISRDVILLLGAIFIQVIQGNLKVEPTPWGKATTFFQMLVVIAILLQWVFSPWIWIITATLTVISGVDYLYKGIQLLSNEAKE